MGVKDLWIILNPVKRQCHLSELKGKRLAVDLSGWVCEADTAKGLSTTVAKPHLRNLFFRIYRLYSYVASLIVIVDGEAIQLKWSTLDQREKLRKGYHGSRKTGHRRQLDSKIRECCQLMDILGVPHLQAVGEADALCGLLSSKGIVDGVITQDNDMFLYGATTVYRDLSTNEKNPQVDCYTSEDIASKLGLTRLDLISFALLLGCDYCPQGVPGVGKESSMKLIRACRSHDPSCDMLEVLRGWSFDKERSEECSAIEKQVQRKALSVSGFPNEAIISEYLISHDTLPLERDLEWKRPDVKKAQSFCSTHLEWKAAYTREKMLGLVTQWIMRERAGEGRGRGDSVRPTSIMCSRVKQLVPCYQVKWEECDSVICDAVCPGSGSSSSMATKPKWVEFITIENADQFRKAYPDLCSKFEEEKEMKKASKKKHKLKAEKKPATSSTSQHEPTSLLLSPTNLISSTSQHESTSLLLSPTNLISSTLQTLSLSPDLKQQLLITSSPTKFNHNNSMIRLNNSTDEDSPSLTSEVQLDDESVSKGNDILTLEAFKGESEPDREAGEDTTDLQESLSQQSPKPSSKETEDQGRVVVLPTRSNQQKELIICDSGQEINNEPDEAPLPLLKRLQSSRQKFMPMQDRINRDEIVRDELIQDKIQKDELNLETLTHAQILLENTVQDELFQNEEHEVVYVIDLDSDSDSNDVITDGDDVIEITASPKRPCPNHCISNMTPRRTLNFNSNFNTHITTVKDIQTPPTTIQTSPINTQLLNFTVRPPMLQQVSHDCQCVSHDSKVVSHDTKLASYECQPQPNSIHTLIRPTHQTSHSKQPIKHSASVSPVNQPASITSNNPPLPWNQCQQQHLVNTTLDTPKSEVCTSKENVSSSHCKTGCGTDSDNGLHSFQIGTSLRTSASLHFKENVVSSDKTTGNSNHDVSSFHDPVSLGRHLNIDDELPAPVWTTTRSNKAERQSGSSLDCPIVIN